MPATPRASESAREPTPRHVTRRASRHAFESVVEHDETDWRHHAACTDLPARAVFATREVQARPALRRCEGCPVQRECLAEVDPAASWFDGVCGGGLWRNGRLISPDRKPATQSA